MEAQLQFLGNKDLYNNCSTLVALYGLSRRKGLPGAQCSQSCHMEHTRLLCLKYIVKSGLESRAGSEIRCVAMLWNDVETFVLKKLKNAALD